MDFSTTSILGIPMSCASQETVLGAIEQGCRKRDIGRYISITNTESLYHATRLEDHAEYIRNAAFSCCDGVGVVLAGKMRGRPIPRLYGPTLMAECCRYGVEFGWRHFFYGGKEGVAELLSRNLIDRYPGLLTAGTYCPPFRLLTPEEDEAVIKLINEAKPDILWVGLGLLKQERWIAEHLGKIDVPWMVGVGAAFDFHAGTVVRAPGWISKVGFEWLYRLVREPRMFRRNLRSIPFLFMAMKEALTCRFRASGETATGARNGNGGLECKVPGQDRRKREGW